MQPRRPRNKPCSTKSRKANRAKDGSARLTGTLQCNTQIGAYTVAGISCWPDLGLTNGCRLNSAPMPKRDQDPGEVGRVGRTQGSGRMQQDVRQCGLSLGAILPYEAPLLPSRVGSRSQLSSNPLGPGPLGVSTPMFGGSQASNPVHHHHLSNWPRLEQSPPNT